jgi:hypothetical protein
MDVPIQGCSPVLMFQLNQVSFFIFLLFFLPMTAAQQTFSCGHVEFLTIKQPD